MHRLLAALFLVAASQTVTAVPIKYGFTGALTLVPAELSSVLAVGNVFAGSVIIDSEAVDLSSDTGIGTYGGNPSLQITLGGNQFSDAVGGRVIVQDNSVGVSGDGFVAFGDVQGVFGGFIPRGFAMQLFDDSGSVFSSDALPTALSLGDFNASLFQMSFMDPESFELFTVEGTLRAVAATVDEPASAFLAMSALGWCLLLARRSSRPMAGPRFTSA